MKSLFTLILMLALGSLVSAREIRELPLDFSLTVPDEFREVDGVRSNPNLLHSFVLGSATNVQPAVLFMVENLNRTISRDELPELTTGLENRTPRKELWQGYEINVTRGSQWMGSEEYITLSAEVPLIPNAILLRFFGRQSEEEQINGFMKSVLASLKGQSNWKDEPAGPAGPAAAWPEKSQQDPWQVWGLLAVQLVAVVVVVIAFLMARKIWRRSRGRGRRVKVEG